MSESAVRVTITSGSVHFEVTVLICVQDSKGIRAAMITVDRLYQRYPGQDQDTLKDISLSVNRGEVFGLLGPSGAGKSTLQNILIQLIPKYRGDVTILDRDLGEWGRELNRHIGVTFELPNHFSKLTARENLEYFASLYPQDCLQVKEVLCRVDLQDHANKRVGEYSKGMKNRLGVARAMIHQPQLYFMDEPTAGLDPNNIARFRENAHKLLDQGATIMLNTHDMLLADQLCDRVAFIHDGRICEIGAPRQLKLDHGEALVDVRVDDPDDEQGRLHTFALDQLGNNDDFQALIRNHRVRTIHSREAALDQVFMKVTGASLTDRSHVH